MHTPGPWHWVDPRTDEPISTMGHEGGSLRTIEEFGEDDGLSFRLPKFILNADEMTARTSDENAANALLIATAPDLYAALDQLLDDMGADGLCVCQAAKDLAKAALAKARGESK